MPAESALYDEDAVGPSPKHIRSSVGGPLHDKMKSVWCRQAVKDQHTVSMVLPQMPHNTHRR